MIEADRVRKQFAETARVLCQAQPTRAAAEKIAADLKAAVDGGLEACVAAFAKPGGRWSAKAEKAAAKVQKDPPKKSGGGKGGQKDPPKKSGEAMLLGSSVQPSTFTIQGGEVVPLGDVVAEAYRRSELSVEEWNSLEDADIESRIAEVVAELPLAAGGDGK